MSTMIDSSVIGRVPWAQCFNITPSSRMPAVLAQHCLHPKCPLTSRSIVPASSQFPLPQKAYLYRPVQVLLLLASVISFLCFSITPTWEQSFCLSPSSLLISLSTIPSSSSHMGAMCMIFVFSYSTAFLIYLCTSVHVPVRHKGYFRFLLLETVLQ